MFEIIAIPAFRDNYIWGLTKGRQAALVDPGDAAPAIAWLQDLQLELTAILITHHHQDHQGGIAGLLQHVPGTPILGPGAESITGLSVALEGGEVIQVLEEQVRVLSVPGHTRGHLAYLAGDALFCGDTLFGAGCGRLFEGTPEQMAAAMDTIAALPDETRIYCAHEYTLQNLAFATLAEPGNEAIRERIASSKRLRGDGIPTVPSSLRLEKATNPFLRCHESGLIAKVRERNPEVRNPVQVFAALRAWRDEF